MNTVTPSVVAASLLSLLLVAFGCASKPAPQANLPSSTLADFNERIGRYAKLQQQIQTGKAEPQETKVAGDLDASKKTLAARMRVARADAKQGDIFSPAIAITLRQALNNEVRGRGAANTRATIREHNPVAFRLRVNDDYPEGATFPTVPPNVLGVLPTLPDGLEYRIVDEHLIIRDRNANIVVDYMFDVMCAKC